MKNRILSVLFLMIGVIAAMAQNNTLTIPSVTAGPGKTISLPVNLDNTADVVALQFTLTVPDGVSLYPGYVALTERTDGLRVNMREMSAGKYLAMIFSAENKAIRGRTGTVMTVPMTTSLSLKEGTELSMTLSDVVIGIIDGSDVTTGYEAGTIIIGQSPDLEVRDVAANVAAINPGEEITVSWQVSNIGEQPTGSGWTEQIYFESPEGNDRILSTIYYDEILNAGGIVGRSANIVVPEILGIDGKCRLKVRITPNSDTGEPTWQLDNNMAVSSEVMMIGKKLWISPENINVEENSGEILMLMLSRSGNTDKEENFEITSDADARIKLPTSVTIPEGQSSVYIYIGVTANGELDDNSIVNISVSGHEYNEAKAVVNIEDDIDPVLTLDADRDEMTEGETIKFIIEAERAPSVDMEIKLTSDFPKRFTIPTIVLPAGEKKVEALVAAIEDDVPDVLQFVTFTASANGYVPSTFVVDLADNDVPTLELSITPDAVSESAGPVSVSARLRRTDNIDKRVTVKFTDDSDGNIYYDRQSVEMPAGVEEVTIALGPIDNDLVEGERIYNISASVWISSCSCSVGTSGGVVTVPLTVYDNDGPSLSLKTSTSVMQEGGEIEITVSRNTAPTDQLAVKVSTDNDDSLEYPSVVIIPKGEKSATFVIKSLENDINDDSFTAVVTVECEGYSKANTWIMVTDQTLPDGSISSVSVSEKEVEVGSEIEVTATIVNTGSYELPEMTTVGFHINSVSTPLATAYLQSPLQAGDSVKVTKRVTMPDAVGIYKLYVVVNDGQNVKELLYTNNTSATTDINVVSPFTITLKTDKEVYNQGDPINITGHLNGNDVSSREIDIYVINEGFRSELKTETDENGNFSANYEPYQGQVGHFVVGACYPGEGLTESMAEFEIYGMKRSGSGKIYCKVYKGEDFDGKITISNPGKISLTNLNVSVTNPDNCEIEVECPETLTGGESADINFKIKALSESVGNDWQQIVLEFNTAEGASLKTILYYYCYSQNGKLKSSVPNIRTTMTKDAPRNYQFELTNIGKGATGTISLSLPEWMSAVTPKEMASLEYEESAVVVLQFNPNDKMQLNVPVTGQIGINCEKGVGLAIPFSIEPVSETTGVLTIDVCDENTYYTAEAPHLQGAKVEIKHPTTGAYIADGVTDENGKFSLSINEGYYSVYVTADKHSSYRNNILVDPGVEKMVTVNLSFDPITIGWNVEETEIEDEYKVTTTVSYETNVPVPVVVMTAPASVPAKELAEGESLIFNVTLTNKGLITAKDVQFFTPEGFRYLTFEPLADIDGFDLAPQQSVQIPVKVTRVGSGPQSVIGKASRYIDDDPCIGQPGTLYFWECGEDNQYHRVGIAIQLGPCKSNDPSTWNPSRNPSGGGGGGGGWYLPFGSGGSGGYIGGGSGYTPVSGTTNECRPSGGCLPRVIAGCGASVAGCLTGGLANAISCSVSVGASCTNISSWWDVANCLLAGGGCIPGPVGCALGLGGCISSIAQCVLEYKNGNKLTPKFMAPAMNDERMLNLLKGITAITEGKFLEVMGSSVWMNVTHDDLMAISDYVDSHIIDDELIIDGDWESVKPENISRADLLTLLERFANTALVEQGKPVNGNNYADVSEIIELNKTMKEYEKQILNLGYDDYSDFVDDVYNFCETLEEQAEQESSKSVCSSITIQIEQRIVMTRQAFRGTLTVSNGNETTAMTDVKLNLIVKDMEGNVATSHEFQINPESLEGFEGQLSFDDGWTLDYQKTGVVKVLFIPTKYAAPIEDKLYSFGGTLSYVDPFTGLVVTRELSPVTLTVKPSPNLDLTYFMQRDVIGDDPLTEAIEPCEEAEFSLLVNNMGYGDATNVKIITEQPKIVENEKGLLIDFELISSQLNGEDKTLALGGSVVTDFGTIPAKSTSYAQWWLKGSLLGHFTKYDVEATHVTSYDNPDLSLLNNVTIHELIRSVEINSGDKKLTGFMTNDFADFNDYPDMMYLSNGEIESVAIARSSSISKMSDTEYLLTVTPSTNGWNYGNITDPTYGVVKLNKVVRRSDGSEISLRNFWQTDRTLRDGKDPLYENKIHFADDYSNTGEQSYILTFEPMPDLLLEVASIDGVPQEDTVAPVPVETVNVVFNKYIDASTFTADDITLHVQGEKQDSSLIGISTDDNKTFTLDFTELNKVAGNGYYVLTVQTSEITDFEGYKGHLSKSASWNMYKDGVLLINTSVNPVDAGVIHGNRNAQYGGTASLTAEANDGYTFSHWTIDGEDGGREPEWSSTVLSDMDVIANFIPNTYAVNIDQETEGGSIQGFGSGIYQYGDEISVKAVADKDYQFLYWTVNGENNGNDPTLTINVTANTDISAEFVYIGEYELNLNIAAGWNWVSHYFNPSLRVDNFMANGNIERILSHTKEVIRDPELGIVGTLSELTPDESYKIESSKATSISLNGYSVWEPSSLIKLKAGWNWIGYHLTDARMTKEVLSPDNAEIYDVIVGQNGFAQFDGDNWVGTLDVLTPGEGYMYQSRSDKNIVYNSDAAKVPVRRSSISFRRDSYILDIHKYASIMPVVATLRSVGGEMLDNGDYQVNAFCGSECRGIGRVVNGLVMMNVYGNANDNITFMVTDVDGGVMFANEASLSFGEQVVGNINEPFEIAINSGSGVSNVSYDGNIKVSVVDDRLVIKGIAAEDIDLVEIFDMDGYKLIHETHVPESGIRISCLETGIYVVIVNGRGEYSYHKIALK